MLVVMRSADDPASARVIFDPNAASAKGSLAVDFYVPSFGGKYVAAALSENGSEDASAHVFEVATGKELRDVVPRVNFATAGGSIAWKADSSGFYYTRYPQGNERPPEDANFYQQVYFHKLGTDPEARHLRHRQRFPAHRRDSASRQRRRPLAARLRRQRRWRPVRALPDGFRRPLDPAHALRRRHRLGQVRRRPGTLPALAQRRAARPDSAPAARPISISRKPRWSSRKRSGAGSDESDRASIEDFVPAWNHLYVIDIMGGPSRVRVFGRKLPSATACAADRPGFSPREKSRCPRSPPSDRSSPSAAAMCCSMSPPFSSRRLGIASTPPPESTTRTVTASQTSAINFDDAEVVRDFATSKDGTRVPLNIIRRKGTKLDGTNPTLLYGYGGYGISKKPFFSGRSRACGSTRAAFSSTPICAAAPNTAKNGTPAGNLTHKQNVFDDFLACAQYLIDQKYTSPGAPRDSWAAATEAC